MPPASRRRTGCFLEPGCATRRISWPNIANGLAVTNGLAGGDLDTRHLVLNATPRQSRSPPCATRSICPPRTAGGWRALAAFGLLLLG